MCAEAINGGLSFGRRFRVPFCSHCADSHQIKCKNGLAWQLAFWALPQIGFGWACETGRGNASQRADFFMALVIQIICFTSAITLKPPLLLRLSGPRIVIMCGSRRPLHCGSSLDQSLRISTLSTAWRLQLPHLVVVGSKETHRCGLVTGG